MATASMSIAMDSGETSGVILNSKIESLSTDWDLNLPQFQDGDSPSKRAEREQNMAMKCSFRIKFLFYRKRLTEPLVEFNQEANKLYRGWVYKPHAERGVVPSPTRRKRKPVSDSEREQLLECLFGILEPYCQDLRTPRSTRMSQPNDIDDSPIQISLMGNKRRSDNGITHGLENKKLKQQSMPESSNALTGRSINAMPPPDRGRGNLREFKESRSANTSFASNHSTVFSVPSLRPQDTQDTVPDDDYETDIQTRPNTRPPSPTIANCPSSEYEGGSSFEQHVKESFDAFGLIKGVEVSDVMVEDELSQDLNEVALNPAAATGMDAAKEVVHERLMETFPKIPQSWAKLPFYVLYEITRVSLHTDVPMKDFTLQKSFISKKKFEYDEIWSTLESLPAFKDKIFPERSAKVVWESATRDYRKGAQGVVFVGSLKYTPDAGPSDPIFRFRLEPMKFDTTHRFSRRFGVDRFLELDMPDIAGRSIPKILQQLGGDGESLLVEWLVDGTHRLGERTWKPFHVKKKERKNRKGGIKATPDIDVTHRVYFFATDGHDFQVASSLQTSEDSLVHVPMSIRELLDFGRPTRKNTGEKYLKLFARTDLLVSRNTATVVLAKSRDERKTQIFYEDDIRYNGEVMTDGAGQISPRLAYEITQKLGLGYCPSGFQGRIGEAKGFWSVDYSEKDFTKQWIKVLSSQRKWKPSEREHGEGNHESHRTFEVVAFSAPLKSADLNLQFFPLLIDRAMNKEAMADALKHLLVEGLHKELADLEEAMEDPRCFRKWLRDNNSGIGERLKNSAVPYQAGLPTSTEERLNMMLDAGFDPKKIFFMKDLAKGAFKSKCEELESRLNITIGKSTYAYMIPDFAQVLEPDEIYMDFSSFIDDNSGFSGVHLNGVNVLVARSPAHYISDIQKVKAVLKVELMGLKDVIVFPTKGNPSLAAKLSGGDYDGDIAWVCWEPSIVDNFESANIPEIPDLVKEGYLSQDLTLYKDLVNGGPGSTSVFLKHALRFNLQPSFLGIATSYKEKVVYTQESVSTRQAIDLSTLLSCLVDQAKQGYVFSEKDYDRFKKQRIKIRTKEPSYKDKSNDVDRTSNNIIDRLVILAVKTTDDLLTKLWNDIPDPPCWDEDLAHCYQWANDEAEQEFITLRDEAIRGGASQIEAVNKAKKSAQWRPLLKQLDEDIKKLKSEWGKLWAAKLAADKKNESKGDKPEVKDDLEFAPIMEHFYYKFQSIQPCQNSLLARCLNPNYLPNPEVSQWALLRASALFFNCRGSTARFPWVMAGKQLATLKAQHVAGNGFPHTITTAAYAMLRPDNAYVKRARLETTGNGMALDEHSSIINADELDDRED